MSTDPPAARAAVVAVLDKLGTDIPAGQSATGRTDGVREAHHETVGEDGTAVDAGDVSASSPRGRRFKAKMAELEVKLARPRGYA